MNLVSAGVSMRQRLAKQATGSLTVTIKRTGQADLTGVPARPAETKYEQDSAGFGLITTRDFDFIIAVNDYGFGNPANGDVIVSDHDGTSREYLVGSRAGSPPFEPHDRTGTEYRVHTIQSDPPS